MQAPLHHNYQAYTDEALLKLVAKQDVRAYELLYDRHAKIIYGLLMRIVKNSTIADDLLQDTFWQLWKKAKQYQNEGAAAAWLYRIARNKALDQLRRQKSCPQLVDTPLEERTDISRQFHATNSTELEAEQMWNRQDIRQALDNMPKEQRQCLELAYFEGMSQREIAKVTNTALGTVKTRMRMGLEKLERTLRGSGYP